MVSELCWLRNPVPDLVREFFRFGYPDMKSVPENIEIAEAGCEIFNIYTLPEKAWIEDYYEILGSRGNRSSIMRMSPSETSRLRQ